MTKISNNPDLGQGLDYAERERRKKVVEDYRHSNEAFEHFGASDLEPARRLANELGFANIAFETGCRSRQADQRLLGRRADAGASPQHACRYSRPRLWRRRQLANKAPSVPASPAQQGGS